MTKREQLIGEIEAFQAAKGLSEHQFGMLLAQNHKFMPRLRRGAVNARSMDAAEAFMLQHAATPAERFREMLRAQPAAPPVPSDAESVAA